MLESDTDPGGRRGLTSEACPCVTVAIPVLNGARYLDEVLTAVRNQRVDGELEVLVIDSGSSDGSREIAERHGAKVHEIRREDFSHGGTRNLAMRLARGAHVAFLTQDATPAHDGWLSALLDGFERAPDVAAVFGPHLPRPAASHMIARQLEDHFRTWGDGTAIDVQRLERDARGLADYRASPGRYTFLSSVNCCLARRAWERVPYRDVPYAEDQLLGREIVEAGYAKVFHPQASVCHSHVYRPTTFLRRYFDEYRGLREVLGHRESADPRHAVATIRDQTRADTAWLRQHGVSGLRLRWGQMNSVGHYAMRTMGAALGSRAGRLPSWVRRPLSLEGRADYRPFNVPESAILAGEHRWSRLPVAQSQLPWHFISHYPAYDGKPVLSPHAARSSGALTLAWVVPPWGVGSGGHTAIFQIIRELEQRGHRSAIFVFDPFSFESRPAFALRREIREHFTSVQAEVFVGLDHFHSADIALATNWWSAYPVSRLPNCLEKVYFVQDYESLFHPRSAETLWADATYRMGFRCVTYTPWLRDTLRRRFGADSRSFTCGVDLSTYTFGGYEEREPDMIAVYARQETPRRGVALAFAALAMLAEQRPDIRIVLYGSNVPLAVPFRCENLGVVPPDELAALYRTASVGIVFSLTNLSLVDQEMMASGLPLVELNTESVRSVLGNSGEVAMLADPQPSAIAAAIGDLLDNRDRAASMALRAQMLVATRSWHRSAAELEALLWSFVAHPRPSSVPPFGPRPESTIDTEVPGLQ